MKILSINFGHDASLCFFNEGILIEFNELERETRLKHQLGITSKNITDFLNRININFEEVDIVSVSGTQAWGLFHSKDIEIEYNYKSIHKNFDLYFPTWKDKNKIFYPGLKALPSIFKNQIDSRQLISSYSPIRKFWDTPCADGLNISESRIKNIFNTYSTSNDLKIKYFQSNFFEPLSIKINGVSKPGFYVDHHIAHAYYAGYYALGSSLVATLDGGTYLAPYIPGGIYWFDKNKGILPISSHRLPLGAIYDSVASTFNLDCGKLMGLSSYGCPNNFIKYTFTKFKKMYEEGQQISESFFSEEIKFASAHDNKFIDIGSANKFDFNVGNRDFAIQCAANAQYFVQEIYVDYIGKFCSTINHIIPNLKSVYTTGGFSLNCPTNTKLNQNYPGLNFTPLPGVGDTGLSLGAAVSLCYLFDVKLHPKISNPAYPPSTFDINIKKDQFKKLHKISDDKKIIIEMLSNELLKGRIVCRHSRRSEVGPRALGRRSIIAWAGKDEIRDIINNKKGRENWRPLAPLCMSEDFNNFFVGDPNSCEFMLTISKVISEEIPAVTHVDGTARVQIIDLNSYYNDKELCDVIENIRKKKLPPILINTSFNCAGEPIVETVEDAARSFLKMGFDYLWTNDGLYTD